MPPRKSRAKSSSETAATPAAAIPEIDEAEILPPPPDTDIFAPPPPEPGMPGSDRSPFENLAPDFTPAAGWELLTSATPVSHAATLDQLVTTLPELIQQEQYRRLHHNQPTQRQEGNSALASLLLLENDLLEISKGPNPKVGNRIRAADRNYPDSIRAKALQLAGMNDALFQRMKPDLITNCWFAHAAQAAPGSRKHLGIAQATEAWQEQMERIQAEPVVGEFFIYEWPPEIDIAALPERKPVKIGGYTKQGWPNIRFEPEAGYQALVRMAHVKRLGAMVIQQHQD